MSRDYRLTLYGKPCTKEDIAKEVARLFLRRAQTPSQIANTLGYQRRVIYDYMNLAVSLGLLKKTTHQENDRTRYEKPDLNTTQQAFQRLDSDKFAEVPLVQEWLKNLLTKKNGKPIKTWRARFNHFKNFCNTFKLKPEQLIIDKKTYLEILTNAKIAFDQGAVVHDRSAGGGVSTPESREGAFHSMKMATRDFVQFHGIALPKNIGGIASGKVRGHGQYADIRLTLEEIEKAEQYIEAKYGLDSDLMRVFSVGVCTGARLNALVNIECVWTEIPNPIKPEIIAQLGLSKTVFVMKAYETKTETNWTKYIIRSRAQQSLLLHKAKNQFTTILTKNSIKHYDVLAKQLKEVYKFLGKEFVHKGYFMRKAFHALRHIAAQYWIKISKGNLTLVCKTCGWKSDLELIASYGEIPPEMTIEMIGTVAA